MIATEFDYQTVPNDTLGVKKTTLRNGLTLLMSVNDEEPRVMTHIVVKAGSKDDPADATGLAHYLEHMMFKGTSKIGALDWAQESSLLDQISDLYEAHRSTTDEAERKGIYAKIDAVSGAAAQLVATNEYDKIVKAIGAKSTNAYTSNDQTVYINDVPSNELERWMRLESERFRELTLRLFHTELETVYEEFNIGQDDDQRKAYKILLETLYPDHPYGTQTTIGTGEHLKNPSHVRIKEFFAKNYVANNMAIVLAGDFDPDEATAWAEKYFGNYEMKPVTKFEFKAQKQLADATHKIVFGQEADFVEMAWNVGSLSVKESDLLTLLGYLLYNGKAGLIDIDLVQEQKTLEAAAFAYAFKDFSLFGLYAMPREGQTLEEAERLLLDELGKVRNGDFDDKLLKGVIKNLKISEIKANESNSSRVKAMTNIFGKELNWEDYVQRFGRWENVTKKEIMDFVNQYLTEQNYVSIHKKTGEDTSVLKVEKPSITPIAVNRDDATNFAKELLAANAPLLTPQFVDYQSEIQSIVLKNDWKLDAVKNTTNELFSLSYIIARGKHTDRTFPLALHYLEYLGTERYSASQLRQEFFNLGVNMTVTSQDEKSIITLAGLEESMEASMELLEHLLRSAKPDETVLENIVEDILTDRENAKKDKAKILRTAMAFYARYGKNSPYLNDFSESELQQMSSEKLMTEIHSFVTSLHHIFYYGTSDIERVGELLEPFRPNYPVPLPARTQPTFEELPTDENQVMVVDFPMVQAEVLMVSKGTPRFTLSQKVMADWYNGYFGTGLSSVVFQEIRESKAFAYSTYAYFESPTRPHRAHYMQAYVGTQPDKLPEAIPALYDILDTMPIAEEQIETARLSVLNSIETHRISRSKIYSSYLISKDLDIYHDLRKDIYDTLTTATAADLIAFQKANVAGRKYTILILGSVAHLPIDFLKTLGNVTFLTLDEISPE